MGLNKTSDGRYLVGLGVESGNDYKGSNTYRDLYIQLTADGATDRSFEYLNYLKEYAEYHSPKGEPVMPPSVNVWISNNGTTTAVEADDISLTDGVYTICGIKYTSGAWDFSDAGQGGSSGLPETTPEDAGKAVIVNESGTGYELGSGGSSLPPYTSADKGKGLLLAEDAEHLVEKVVVPEQTGTTASLGVPGFYGFVLEDAYTSFFENAQEGDELTLYEFRTGEWRKVGVMTYLTDPDTGISAFFYGDIRDLTLKIIGFMGDDLVFAAMVESITWEIKATASVPSVAPAWVQQGGAVTVTVVQNDDTSVNTADYLFKVNGVVLTSFSDCKTFLESLAGAASIKIVPEGAESGTYAASLGATIVEEENVNIATISIYNEQTFSICGYTHVSLS